MGQKRSFKMYRNQRRIVRLRLVPAFTDHNEKQRKLSDRSPDDAHAGQNILDRQWR
jgi:hypothetical protein